MSQEDELPPSEQATPREQPPDNIPAEPDRGPWDSNSDETFEENKKSPEAPGESEGGQEEEEKEGNEEKENEKEHGRAEEPSEEEEEEEEGEGSLDDDDDENICALKPLPITTLEQLARVYVRPESFKNLARTLEALQRYRVLIVHGREHAGKLATGVAIAARLLLDSGELPLIYRRKPQEVNSLLDVIQNKDWVRRSVVILEDALNKNVALSDFEPPELDHLTEALGAKRSFLIVTVLDSDELNPVSAPKALVKVSQLQDILRKHVKFYEAEEHGKFEKQLTDLGLWDRLCGILKTPFHVDRFCARLQELENKKESDIDAFAQSIGQIGQRALRSWFEGLSSNAKLLSMLVYLFEGLDAKSLEDLFTMVVFRFRSEGFSWVQDPRKIGFQTLLETIRAHGQEGEVDFEDTTVKEEVAWQTGNRQALLWSALDPIVAETTSSKMWYDPGRRAALGTAIGRMGNTDSERFLMHLDSWARSRGSLPENRRDGIAALAGYAMAEALRRDPEAQRDLQLQKLQIWIGSKDPDLMWTAGAAIWRIYPLTLSHGHLQGTDDFTQSLRSELKRLLRELVRISGRNSRLPYEMRNKIRKCVIFALKKIGRADTGGLVEILLEWMPDRQIEHLRRIAHKATQESFETASKLGSQPVAEKSRPLLLLVKGIFATASGAAPVCRSLCRFLENRLRWDSWRDEISTALLYVANQGTSRMGSSLREALSHHWLQTADPEVENLGRAMIARSYAMNGILTDRPLLGRCVVVVDPALFEVRVSGLGQEKEVGIEGVRRRGAFQQLLASIEVQMEVSVVLLGGNGLGARSGVEKAEWLIAAYPIQRLMMPAIGEFVAEGARLVLVVTTGPVLDLEDALESISADVKIVIAAGCELEPPVGVEFLRVGRSLSAKDVETVEKRLQAIWAETLVKSEPEVWIPSLEALGVSVQDLEHFESSLEDWVSRLEALESATGRTDLAKRIICVLLWLSAGDFEACLQIVRRWLTEGEETDIRRFMGAAAGFALFRFATDAPMARGASVPMRLFDELAGPMGRFGQDGSDAVLQAVEHWIADPDLAAGLAGGIEEGRGRLLRWAEEFAPQERESFEATLERLRSALHQHKEDLGSVGEALGSIFDRLHVRFNMGRPRPLPSLGDGERYGVIVLDASASKSAAGARWAQLASALFARFNKDGERGLKPIVYRLGERWPAWVAGDPDPQDVDLSFRGFRLPRLLGPILTSGLSLDQVGFMVVLADEAWLDGEDWIDSPWRERLLTCRQLREAPWAAVFPTLPNLQEKEKGEVDRIAEYLRQRSVNREEHRDEN